jgi:hypothetical protein
MPYITKSPVQSDAIIGKTKRNLDLISALKSAPFMGGFMSKPSPSLLGDTEHTVCWGAITAGAFAAAGMTVILATLGTATGLALVTPWSNSGVSAGTFKIAAGGYLVLTAIISSVVGGYMAGRLRSKWINAPRQEVLFRDTAHGMVAWAFATLALVAVLGTGTGSLISSGVTGIFHGASQGVSAAAPTDYYVDMLLRPAPTSPGATATTLSGQSDPTATRREISSIFTRSFGADTNLSSTDRSYLVQVVAQRSGMSEADANKRVADVTTQTKTYLDNARKYSIAFALWVTVALFAGAFAAAAGAIEGGQLRDGRWRGILFAPRDEIRSRR